jgi:hypothetical protein
VPWAGPRRGNVTARRPAVDCAPVVQELVAVESPHAEKRGRVLAPLHPPTPASLEEAFAPAAARRWRERLALPYPPPPGRWLPLAETALRVLAPPWVARRRADPAFLTPEVVAWEHQRHTARCRVEWRFTTPDARITLKRLYPSIQLGEGTRTLINCLNTGSQKACKCRGMCSESCNLAGTLPSQWGQPPPCPPGNT